MKFENLDNLKSEAITKKEVQDAESAEEITEKLEENIEKTAIEGVEKEIEEFDVIEEKEGKMSSLKKAIKKAIVGISIILASMIATEAAAGGISGKQKEDIKKDADSMFE